MSKSQVINGSGTTGTGAVTSVFTRTGDIVAAPADYSAFYVPLTRNVNTGAGLNGGGALSADLTLSAVALGASGASHAAGIAPDPGVTAGTTRFLCENATWATPSASAGVSSFNTRTGAVVPASGDYTAAQVGAVPSTRNVNTGAGLTGGGALSADLTLSAVPMAASGTGHSAGTVPDPGTTAGTTHFLREDATWATLPAAPVASVFGRTGAVVAVATDYTPTFIGAVPTTTTVSAGAGLSGGGALSANVTLSAVPMAASGASHAAGIVPDPGATAGTTKFLREDATWVVPPGGFVSPLTTKGDIHTFTTVDARLAVGTVANQMLLVDSTQAAGIKWATPTAAMVTNAVDQTGSYANPAWISSYAWSKLTGYPSVTAGTGLSGGGALTGNVTLNAVPMAASGASHSGGTVPDPGSTAGTTRFLREDAAWVVPPGGGMTDPTTTKGDLIVHGTTTTRMAVGSDSQVVIADSTQTLGVKWGAAPVIVAVVNLTAQAANVANSLLYAIPSTAGGMYRLNILIVLTRAATTSSTLPYAVPQWTDADTSVTLTMQVGTAANTQNAPGSTNAYGEYPNVLVLNLKAGTNLNYATAGYVSSGATTMQYAVHIQLEYFGS
ncbi:MAG: hypothetical protein C5B60_11430 [Chloroflexi bacterium]|nr:MAG: hypothetical protein C5B60_11430 [Chloroflexota bacterium]